MYLMCKDSIVLKINAGECKIYREDLLPYRLKYRLIASNCDSTPNKRNLPEDRVRLNNELRMTEYLANRVLPLSRSNAKTIYNLFGFEQSDSYEVRRDIALKFRAVSVIDNFWTLDDEELGKVRWRDVNVRENRLNEVVMLAALHGESFTLDGSPHTPEVSGQGVFAKAWKREDGKLWLYKRGNHGDSESRVEVMISNLLDKCNVEHVHYEDGFSSGKFGGAAYCCKCPCITNDEKMIIPASDFRFYCNARGLNFLKEVLKVDAENIYKMWIIDYLIANNDRHGKNWGFYADGDSMELLGCHPLFDHNLAFNSESIANPDYIYEAAGGISQRDAAQMAIRNVDFHFTDPVTREDFLTSEQWECFTLRARDLGIENPTKGRSGAELARMRVFD